MSKKNKKSIQKIIVSLVGAIILMILGYLGIDIENINIAAEQTIALETFTELQIYFKDVGQADCILVKNQEDAMLIDAGNNEDGEDVVKFLKDKGVTKLDYVIGTHPHEDHIGGLDNVINSDIVIENIYMPKIKTNTKTFESVLDAISNKNLTVTAPNKGDVFEIGEARCEVMTDSILDEDNLNLSSIIIHMQFGENTFLFMGDAETENEKTRNWPKVDVLKVGHHGSNTSTSEEFINQIKPKYAIIMVGKDNTYGLPKQKIMERIENIGAKIYRTDECGTICINSNGKDIKLLDSF